LPAPIAVSGGERLTLHREIVLASLCANGSEITAKIARNLPWTDYRRKDLSGIPCEIIYWGKRTLRLHHSWGGRLASPQRWR